METAKKAAEMTGHGEPRQWSPRRIPHTETGEDQRLLPELWREKPPRWQRRSTKEGRMRSILEELWKMQATAPLHIHLQGNTGKTPRSTGQERSKVPATKQRGQGPIQEKQGTGERHGDRSPQQGGNTRRKQTQRTGGNTSGPTRQPTPTPINGLCERLAPSTRPGAGPTCKRGECDPTKEGAPIATHIFSSIKTALEPAEGQQSHASQRTPVSRTLGAGRTSITGNLIPRTDTLQSMVWLGRSRERDHRDGYHTLSIPTLSDDEEWPLTDTEDEDKEDDEDPRGCTDSTGGNHQTRRRIHQGLPNQSTSTT